MLLEVDQSFRILANGSVQRETQEDIDEVTNDSFYRRKISVHRERLKTITWTWDRTVKV